MIETLKHLLLAYFVGLLIILVISKLITVSFLSVIVIVYATVAIGVGTIQLVLSLLGAMNRD
jgi:hypothetical protein